MADPELAKAAQDAQDAGVWTLAASVATGATALLLKFGIDWHKGRSKPKAQGQSMHDMMVSLTAKVEGLAAGQQDRAIQQARIEERMATKDDLHKMERELSDKIEASAEKAHQRVSAHLVDGHVGRAS